MKGIERKANFKKNYGESMTMKKNVMGGKGGRREKSDAYESLERFLLLKKRYKEKTGERAITLHVTKSGQRQLQGDARVKTLP